MMTMTNMMMTNITMITMVNQVPLPPALDTALAVPANCALGPTTIIIIITITIIIVIIIIIIIIESSSSSSLNHHYINLTTILMPR